MAKPVASLSLDLDNLWSYQKTHGDEGWESYPSYLDSVVPTILKVLSNLNLKCTFFIVGQDAALKKNAEALQSIAEAGHEIGNHSWSHDPWFHLFDEAQLRTEILDAEAAIEKVTGQKPVGWRGPGFSFSRESLRFLAENEYEYDGSIFPSCTGPLARIYYFATSSLNSDEREQRSNLYGSWKDAFRPLKPFSWNWEGAPDLLELPVTTCPIFRTPLHASYLQFLAKFSNPLAKTYFRCALTLCRLTGVAPSFLLHPTDFLGAEDAPSLDFFPAMDQAADVKLERITSFLTDFSRHFDVVPMGEYAKRHHSEKLAQTATANEHQTQRKVTVS